MNVNFPRLWFANCKVRLQDQLIQNVESELDCQAIKGEKYRWNVICLSPCLFPLMLTKYMIKKPHMKA